MPCPLIRSSRSLFDVKHGSSNRMLHAVGIGLNENGNYLVVLLLLLILCVLVVFLVVKIYLPVLLGPWNINLFTF